MQCPQQLVAEIARRDRSLFHEFQVEALRREVRTLALLGTLAQRANEIDKSRPVVVACRSGARSAQAVLILRKLGFKDVVNLAGGMIRWRASGIAVEGGRE